MIATRALVKCGNKFGGNGPEGMQGCHYLIILGQNYMVTNWAKMRNVCLAVKYENGKI